MSMSCLSSDVVHSERKAKQALVARALSELHWQDSSHNVTLHICA